MKEENFVTDNQVQTARKVDVISYLQRYEPQELVSVGRWYSTRTHDSIRINKSTGVWIRNSTGDGGNDAISFLMKVKGYRFHEAVRLLCDSHINIVPLEENRRKAPKLLLHQKKTAVAMR